MTASTRFEFLGVPALGLATLALLGTGCASQNRCLGHAGYRHGRHAGKHRGKHHGKGHRAHRAHRAKVAVAIIRPTAGNTAKGIVRFTQVGRSVKIVAVVEGLTPNAKHGFHIHQFGDCTGPNGKSAGGHYNPEGHAHAGPPAKVRHAGDLGNITADASGKGRLELTLGNVTIQGRKNPIIGRGLIVHKGTDDLKSQPTGAAGPRIGCGVIGATK